jgi:demethylmenaquinone methyltransferase / 2-methoxy-6-polyprenyl-1,4-benzoquinol methylase
MTPAGTGQLEAVQVRSMFDRIAGVYDPLNSAMTAGLHHRWRARAADLAQVGQGSRVLDVACGTGDLAIELAARVAPGGEVLGCDFSENMLSLARAKAARRLGPVASDTAGARVGDMVSPDASDGGDGGVKLHFEWADALALPYPDDSFDAATVGFGVRNFSDRSRGLAEMARVVRPGGRVVVLEMTAPTKPPLSLFFRLWFDRIVPLLGRLAALSTILTVRSVNIRQREGRAGAPRGAPSVGGAQDAGEAQNVGEGQNVGEATIADAYTYLPNSVRRFPSPEGLAAELADAGLCEISYVITAGGIIAIHAATVAP